MSHLPARIAEDIDREEWERIVDLASIGTTDYAFERFVIGQHDDGSEACIPAMAQQAALQAVCAGDEVRRILRDRERAVIALDDVDGRVALTARQKRVQALDRDEKMHEIDQHDRMLVLRLRQWGQAVRAIRKFGSVTVADLEAAEPARWPLRLDRQAAMGALDRQTGGGIGNFDALRQAEQIEHRQIRALAKQIRNAIDGIQDPDTPALLTYEDAYTPPSALELIAAHEATVVAAIGPRETKP